MDAHPFGTILRSFPFVGDVIVATLIGVVKGISYWPNEKSGGIVVNIFVR